MFDTIETMGVSMVILTDMLETMTLNKEKMLYSTEKYFSNATELADYLASKGVPFRQAHEIVGSLVLEYTTAGCYLQDVPLTRYKELFFLIDKDIYDVLQSQTAVKRRNSLGGTGFEQVKHQIYLAKSTLSSE